MTATAKVFWSGRSQAVRLPKEFRFDTDTVTIRREGEAVVLEPAPVQDAAMEAILRRLEELGPPAEDFVRGALDRPKYDPGDGDEVTLD